MVEVLRTNAHQLADHAFDDANELVSYMGAVQGQDLEMCKWAVGIRLKRPSLSHVREAIDSGRIIRTHILRPTWHLVSAEDIRWMLELNGKRIRTAFLGWGKGLGIDEKAYGRFCEEASRSVSGTDGLTIRELVSALDIAGCHWSADQVKYMLSLAEADRLFCSGREKKGKHTYVLLEERVPACRDVTKDEALSLLALKYFRSHSPASVEDFIWWAGLTATEAKSAIGSLGKDLITERYEGEQLYVHCSCNEDTIGDEEVHLLPPYDEYLISYKDRTHVLEAKHSSKAHNNYGIFHPVILYKGKIVGNWKKKPGKGRVEIETAFFTKASAPGSRKLQAAIDRYTDFLRG